VTDESATNARILELLAAAKKIASEYRVLTGKPLGITSEVAEYEAWRILGLQLAAARNPGFDALEDVDGTLRRLQIKGRCVLTGSRTQMVGRIDLRKPWDAVMLVLLDGDFDAFQIHQAERSAVEAALLAPGSRGRNERWVMSVSKFKAIGRLRWTRPKAQ
jgi:hypothetical protein